MYANVSFHFISEIRNSTLWNKKGISKWSLSPTTFDRFEISCTNCPLNIFDIYYIKNVKTRRVRIPKKWILISTISTTQHNQDRDLKCFDDKLCQFNSLLSKTSILANNYLQLCLSETQRVTISEAGRGGNAVYKKAI